MRYTNYLFIGFCCLVVLPLHATADEAQQVFDDVYKARVAQVSASRSKADDVALAAELLNAAKDTKANALSRLLCNNAYDLGMRDDAGYTTAIEAMRTLLGLLGEDAKEADATKAQDQLIAALERQFRVVKADERAKVGDLLIEEILHKGESLAAGGEAGKAINVYRQALITATRTKSDQKDAIKARLDRALERQRIMKQVELHENRLLRKRDDVVAAETLARLYLVELKSPSRAATVASAVKDEKLKQTITLAAKPTNALSPDQCLQLSEGYRALADKASDDGQRYMLTLSIQLLVTFRDSEGVSDIQKAKAKLLLEADEKHLAKLGPAPLDETTTPKANRAGKTLNVKLTGTGWDGRLWHNNRWRGRGLGVFETAISKDGMTVTQNTSKATVILSYDAVPLEGDFDVQVTFTGGGRVGLLSTSGHSNGRYAYDVSSQTPVTLQIVRKGTDVTFLLEGKPVQPKQGSAAPNDAAFFFAVSLGRGAPICISKLAIRQ